MSNKINQVSASVRLVTIEPDRAGQRIDNFLLSCLKGVPRSLVYKIIRKGEVRVNKGRIKPVYKLQAGDIVRIPPVRLSEAPPNAEPAKGLIQRIEQSVIYEDDKLLVLNKPSGVAVHGGSGINYGVIEAIRASRPQQTDLELVHRLDRDTSGCLLISKKRSALRRLHTMLREGQMDKYYVALCHGQWQGGGRRVDAPLRKNVMRSGERVVQVSNDGKAALSQFVPKVRYQDATLMSVKLFTGRTHQIRVHAAHTGHPVAGDEKYGDKTHDQRMKKTGLSRLFLHAETLRFDWPEDGQSFEIKAPLSEPLEKFLQRLPKLKD